jgi:hypothetical protein
MPGRLRVLFSSKQVGRYHLGGKLSVAGEWFVFVFCFPWLFFSMYPHHVAFWYALAIASTDGSVGHGCKEKSKLLY